MVTERAFRRLAEEVQAGRRSPDALVERLRRLPFDNLGFARLDTHRRLRRGLPEVVLGTGKSPAQLRRIASSLLDAGELVLITRLDAHLFHQLDILGAIANQKNMTYSFRSLCSR